MMSIIVGVSDGNDHPAPDGSMKSLPTLEGMKCMVCEGGELDAHGICTECGADNDGPI